MTAPGAARVTFLGHSTMVIDMDGARVLTDPILRARVGPLVRQSGSVGQEQWRDASVVLVSHSHWDHLDVGSLRLIGTGTPLVVPLGLGHGLRRRGFSAVTELGEGMELEIGPLRIMAVHAEHRGFGPPIGGSSRSVGYLIRGSQRHYFAGDTAFFDAMADLGSDLDMACIPVWGWGPTVRQSEHLDPLGAARAISVIGPRFAVPIHWGTLHPLGLRWVRPATRIDPPHQFARLARRLAPRTIVRVVPVGSSLEIPPMSGATPSGSRSSGSR